MSEPMDPRGAAQGAGEPLSPVKRALVEIRDLKAQLAEARGALREPVAIVGMGLRLPGGVRDADGLAELLWSGRDAVTEIPAGRWPQEELYSDDPDAPGKLTTRYGAFLDGVDLFDAEFFGIAPREAESMDPQQRLLLEVAWNALEDAGCAPAALAGSRLGVYLGISNGDYGRALFNHPEAIDVYCSTGNAFSVAAGRLSYFLGAHGPAVSVDTACSSSLVALHLACQGLRHRECDRALVGGVNLILTPEMNIAFSKGRMMAADGRCKTFDAAADGYVRGEGCCVLVLRRLSDALAGGDRILAVVRGSAMNQDGRSGGLTAPSGPAQEAVVRAAVEAAGLAPGDVGYVETHGTGTSLGDPIEVGALAAALCAGRDPSRPLLIGSVKTNIGHLEAAAGLAGVAKAVEALRRGAVPPHLHFKQGNPHIDWTQPIAVPTATTPWPAGARRVAGVSSFGFSGTNAHAILEAAPPATPLTLTLSPREAGGEGMVRGAGESDRPLHLLPLSARDPAALAELARAWEARLASPLTLTLSPREAGGEGTSSSPSPLRREGVGEGMSSPSPLRREGVGEGMSSPSPLRGEGVGEGMSSPSPLRGEGRGEGEDAAAVADLCFTAAAGRSHLAHRLAVVGATAADLRRGLAAHREGRVDASVAAGRAEGARRPQVALLFTGQGAQHPGMGKALFETAPAFRRVLEACDEKLRPLLGRGLLDLLFAPPESSEIHHSAFAQPATFAVEVALATLWRSWGIQPVAVLGHSLGEYAAACVAGALSLDDGLRLVAERGRLMEELPPGGAMAAAFAPEAVVAAEVARAGGEVSLAALNAPQHQVISGRRAAVEAVAARLTAAGVEVKPLHVAHAAHSALVEPALPGLRRAVEAARFQAPRVALVSNVTGAVAGVETLGRPEYWLAHLREPVRFAPCMETLVALGVTHFLEVGPHPVLLGIGAECAPGPGREWLASMRRDRPGWTDLLESLQRLYVSGADVDWAGFDRDFPRRRVAAPAYPFRGRRHWSPAVGAPPATAGAAERWARVSAALDREAERGPLDLDAAGYPARWDVLARLTSAHAQRVLSGAGLFARAGERRTAAEVLAAARISPTYRHLLARWLDGLAARGALRQDGDAYVADAPLAAPDLDALEAEADALLAGNRPLLAYVRHCAALLPAVVTGAESPLETLFPRGSFELAEGLYERSATMRYVNGVAAAALEAIAAATPAGRTLRVLEIGAGTGGTTSSLLPVLAGGRVRYTFTDVSDLFLERGKARFGQHPFVEYRRLDLDQDPVAQGFAAGSYDVVVAANAVHATKDLRAAVARLRGLLSPGGATVLLESTTHHAWFDMTTGLIEGWQHFHDDLRHENPLLPAETWVELLGESGFEAAGAWPRPGSAACHLGQHLVVGRVPGDAAGAVEAAAHPASPGATAGDAAVSVADHAATFRQQVLDALPSERLEVLRGYVRENVVRVLRLAADQAPARDQRLMDMGFDSLMAVQLRNLLGAGLALEKPLPASTMFDHPTIDALAARLLALVAPPAAAAPAGAAPAPAAAGPSPAARVDEAAVAGMSDAEVEALLLEKLGGR